MLRLVVALLILAALPQTAHAAFGEVEPLDLHENECVRVTGAPGQLALATEEAVRLYEASREGLVLQEQVPFASEGFECVTTLVRPGGAGVIAGRNPREILVRFRDPGGAWTPATTLPLEPGWYASMVTAAVSDRGDVLVVWPEERDGVRRIRAARRLAGAGFGPVETVGRSSRGIDQPTAAMASTGEAFVLTARARTTAGTNRTTRVAIAPPGAPFGAPVTLGNVSGDSSVALAAAADGRALVVMPGERSVLVAERPPGGAFGAPVPIADARGQTAVSVQAVVAPDGGAAVAWQRSRPAEGLIVTRGGPGAFGPPRSAGRSPLPEQFDPVIAILLGRFVGPFAAIFTTPEPPLTLTPDGRALFTWWDETREPSAPSVVAAPLAGGPLTQSVGGRSVAGAEDVFAVALSSGAPGLAWTAGGQLHFATEGAVTPAGPVMPRVAVAAPRPRALGAKTTLRLPVRCSAPCEVAGYFGGNPFPSSDSISLPRGGAGTLAIEDAAELLGGPRWRLPVTLVYGAPGGFDARSKTVRLTLWRAANAPDTRIRTVRAVRRGSTVRVTWSIAGRTGEGTEFLLTGTKKRDRGEDPAVLEEHDAPQGRRTFSVTLRAGRDVRWVAVRSDESFVTGRPSFARVR